MKFNDILVLNRSWVPVHIVDYKRCMILLCNGGAQGLTHDFVPYNMDGWMEYSLTPHPFKTLRTSTRLIALPEIIALTKYDRLPRGDAKFSRESVFSRDKYCCGYCGKSFSKNDLTIDHIIPRSKGGTTVWNNVISCCRRCNAYKSDKTLQECRLKLKRKPKEPKWLDPIIHRYRKSRACESWKHFLHRVDLYNNME